MASYVLVHGGGHGGWCWRRVVPLLRAAGHDVYTPTLTGLGERAHLLNPSIGLSTHIADVVGVIEFEGLTNVILAGHSYGGMVITGVADRMPAQIGHLVYLDAIIPGNGEAACEVTPALSNVARPDGRVVDGVELILWPEIALPHMGVTDPDDLAWMKGKLTPHPWRCFEEKLWLANEAAVHAIPRTDINCVPIRPDLAERTKAARQAWEIETGHDLMITEPEALAGMLLRLAA